MDPIDPLDRSGSTALVRLKSTADRADHKTMEDRPDHRGERGATLAEYAMVTALIVGATVAAIGGLTTRSGDYLSTTGDDIGEPRQRIADMDDDLPDPPAWLP